MHTRDHMKHAKQQNVQFSTCTALTWHASYDIELYRI